MAQTGVIQDTSSLADRVRDLSITRIRIATVIARIDRQARQRILAATYALIESFATRYGAHSQAASAWTTGRIILWCVIMLGLYVLMTTA